MNSIHEIYTGNFHFNAVDSSINGLLTGIVSGMTSYASLTITPISFFHGFGIGFIAGVIETIVLRSILSIDNPFIAFSADTAFVAFSLYGISAGAAALGIVAAPITLPSAFILAISSQVFRILTALLVQMIAKDDDCICMANFRQNVYRVQQNPIEIFNIAQNQMQPR